MIANEWSGEAPKEPHKRQPVQLSQLGAHETSVLRVASYNIRVDHSADELIKQDASLLEGRTPGQFPWDGHPGSRRQLAADVVSKLGCDLICIQEPSPDQALELQQDFLAAGLPLAIQVLPCTPALWGPGKPAEARNARHGQQWDGNGFIWNCRRLRLEGSLEQFWLSPTPGTPSSAKDAWPDSSEFMRTCVSATFRDLETGKTIRAFSAHFDHQGGKIESAACMMEKIRTDPLLSSADCVLLCGDFNTFPEEEGATYRALVDAAADLLVDVRGEGERTSERGDDTWVTGGRFDHMFLSPSARVLGTAVVVDAPPASDHRPILAEIVLP
eukprot:TRINITY_DN22808_c0_g1_i2.p1 TRINITY_DN22808_c0_g1~~TRINITY_DN22808_c0_g1_i2.p1  ORF type:complete len:339 (+),score=58.47 TRINITY_DN22808_c0_g1_i2:32-1018(+)